MSVDSEQLCSEAHQSSPQLENSHRSLSQLDNSHRSSPQLENSHRSLSQLDNSHRSSPQLENPHRSSPQLENSHRSLSQLDNSHRSSPQLENSHRSSPQLDNSHRSSPQLDNSHQSSPQLENSHQSSPQLENPHRSSPQRGNSLPSARSSLSLHRSTDQASDSRTALGDVSCAPGPHDGADSSQGTPTDASGHRRQLVAVSETAILERRSPAHRLLHAMLRLRRRFVAPISCRLRSRRHSQCCPPPSQLVRPATPVDLPAAAASDSDDDSEDDVINEVEMLGITEGWGPSPAPRVPPGPTDFVSIIEKVKDCGWYWGAISCSTAESILHSEPDGSFIVRDSGDDRYIFSLTFRLRGLIRHVRIEHDNGNFSFGGAHKFRSNTIVDFIENAVEYSRSGRYLFFLHRRPAHGPMRVQLLHPVSRFKHIQSLQHMARFVILRLVRRDHIARLPLPEPLIRYLSSPHYISEQLDQQL